MTTAKRLQLPDMSWHSQAACDEDNRPQEVPSAWFGVIPYRVRFGSRNERGPLSEPSVQAALALCGGCPVIERCRLQAALDPHAEGVWGGEYITGSYPRVALTV